MGFKTSGHSNRCMTQWIKENMRFRSGKESLRQDFVLMKESDIIRKLDYHCPINRTDYILIVMETGEIDKVKLNVGHRIGRLNFGKTVNGLGKYFVERD